MTSLRADKGRILFLNHSSQLGGGELSLFDIARNMPGCEVALLSSGPLEKKLSDAGVATIRIDAGAVLKVRRTDGFNRIFRVSLALVVLVARLLRKARDARLIYANSQKAFVAGALVSIVARRPLIWHLRDLLTSEHFSGSMLRLTIALANRCADHVIANSAATAAEFRAAGGRTPITVVHSCIDATQFDVNPAELPAAALSADTVVGVFSRLAPWKGQHIVIEAVAQLPGTHVVLVGSALFGEEAYVEKLRRLAVKLGVSDRVHFLGFRHDVQAIMRSVDVVIHSSTSPEPFGRVIVEGMLARKPVIATAAGGALEIVEHGVNGLLVPAGDIGALIEAIRTLADRSDYARSLAENGFIRAEAEFSLDAANARVRDVIDSL